MAAAGGDLGLVRLYWPVALRPAFDALIGVDHALRDVVLSSTQPMLGAIRLAWWREALARLDQGVVPAEPRLRAAADALLTRRITGKELAGLEDGWASLLDEAPDPSRVAARGARLFALGGRLLGGQDDRLADAGRLYAAGQIRRLGFCDLTVETSPNHLAGHVFSRAHRPLSALARLARRDLRDGPVEAEATPARAAALLSHRLFGRVA